jgi:hypothetical protein
MTARLHFAVDGTWFDYDEGCCELVPVCGNDFHFRKKLTDNPDAVTCRECRELCGFDEAALTEQVARELTFTIEQQKRRAA